VSNGNQAAALAGFVVLGTPGPAPRQPSTASWGEHETSTHDSLRGRLARENATIMTVLYLISAKVVGEASAGLTT
jgi:hypothetical protein